MPRSRIVLTKGTLLLLGLTTACGASGSDRSTDVPVFQRTKAVQAETIAIGRRGRYRMYRVRLWKPEGPAATGRLLRPETDTGSDRHPAVLLQNGRELNSRAVEYLPSEFGDVVVLSLDYPEELPYTLKAGDLIWHSRRLRNAARRIAPSFSLGAEYLLTRSDVDSTRLVMVATSFAVPFAVRAAAFDSRFVNVGLIYGAGDMAAVLAANLGSGPRWLRKPVAGILMSPFREFAPERFVGRIAPRPLLMVNGIDDPQMPRQAVEALYDAARSPKEQIWLRTGHLMPTDSALVRALVDTALARLPALSEASAARRNRDSDSSPPRRAAGTAKRRQK